MNLKADVLIVSAFCMLMVTGSCSKKNDEVSPPPTLIPEKPVGVTYDSTTLAGVASFPIGAAINLDTADKSPSYGAIVKKEFNSITPERAMQWWAIQPSQGVFNFTRADATVEYAQKNNKRIYGHALVWHEYYSYVPWVKSYQGDSTAWENLMKNHIQTVAGRYKGKLAGWDVINEPLYGTGGLRVEDRGTGALTIGSIWARKLGRDYIARALQYARAADPTAKLFINDYGLESNPAKRDSMIALVNRLKQRGVPIDGIGFQMHTRFNENRTNIEAAFRAAAGTGLLIHLTELDVSINPNKTAGFVPTQTLLDQQADFYAFIVRKYKELIPAKQQFGITMWNVSDRDSWLVDQYPTMFDTRYAKKPAYAAFFNALKQ